MTRFRFAKKRPGLLVPVEGRVEGVGWREFEVEDAAVAWVLRPL